MKNKRLYKKIYSETFSELYPNLSVEATKQYIEKTLDIALKNIKVVNIKSPAFEMTAKKLGIENTHDSIQKFVG